MAAGFDELVEHLVSHVASSGTRGTSLMLPRWNVRPTNKRKGLGPQEVQEAIVAYYKSIGTVAEARENSRPRSRLFSHVVPESEVRVDADFVETVWGWISASPDVQVKIVNEDHSKIDGVDVASAVPELAGKRLVTSEDRAWHAITGHGIDHTKIPPLEFECLSVIASRGAEGITQPDLVKLTGQDKRSLPKRTDALASKGYITKEGVITGRARTSLLKLKRYNAINTAGKESEGPHRSVDLLSNWFDRLMEMLQSQNEYLVANRDLHLELGIDGRRWELKSLGRCIRRLVIAGVLERVFAREIGRSEDAPREVRCLKLLRAPLPTDRAVWLGLPGSSTLGQAAVHRGIDIDDDVGNEDSDPDAELDNLAADPNDWQDDRDICLWRPDLPLTNLLFRIIDNAGPVGISSMDIHRKVSTLWKRPTDELLMRLTDVWQVSQPSHLKHLAIIKDTAVNNTSMHFLYRSYRNFALAVEQNLTAWEAVITPGQSVPPPTKLDPWGFPETLELQPNSSTRLTFSHEEHTTIKRPVAKLSMVHFNASHATLTPHESELGASSGTNLAKSKGQPIASLTRGLLATKPPGIYVNPPGALQTKITTIQHRGRPRKACIIVIKLPNSPQCAVDQTASPLTLCERIDHEGVEASSNRRSIEQDRSQVRRVTPLGPSTQEIQPRDSEPNLPDAPPSHLPAQAHSPKIIQNNRDEEPPLACFDQGGHNETAILPVEQHLGPSDQNTTSSRNEGRTLSAIVRHRPKRIQPVDRFQKGPINNRLQRFVHARTRLAIEAQLSSIASRDQATAQDQQQDAVNSDPMQSAPAIATGIIYLRRAEIIMDTINQCGGIFPGNREMWYPFATAWEKLYGGRPDRHTVENSIINLIGSRRLKKHNFHFMDKKGQPVTRPILMLPHIRSDSPHVLELQNKIIQRHPAKYVPEEVEVSPDLRTKLANASVLVVKEHKPEKRKKLGEIVHDMAPPFLVSDEHASIPSAFPKTRRKIPVLDTAPVEVDHNVLEPAPAIAGENHISEAKTKRKRRRTPIEGIDVVTDVDAHHEEQPLRKKRKKKHAPSKSIQIESAIVTDRSGPSHIVAHDHPQEKNVLPTEITCENGATDEAVAAKVKDKNKSSRRRKKPVPEPKMVSPIEHHAASEAASEARLTRLPQSALQPLNGTGDDALNQHQPSRLELGTDHDPSRGHSLVNLSVRDTAREEDMIALDLMIGSPLEATIAEIHRNEPVDPVSRASAESETGCPTSHPPDEGESVAANPKRRRKQRRPRRKYGELGATRLIAAYALVKLLCTGIGQSKMNWEIVSHCFHFRYDGEDLRRQFNTTGRGYREMAEGVQVNLQSKFLAAYEAGQLPRIDFGNLGAADWPAMAEWVVKEVMPDVSSHDPSIGDLPRTRDRLHARYEVHQTGPSHGNVADEFFGSMGNLHRKELAHHQTHGISMPDQPPADPSSLALVKTWCRAVVMTPERQYNAATAAQGLKERFTSADIERANAALLSEGYIVSVKKDRQLPGRNYHLTVNALKQFQRWPTPEEQYLPLVAQAHAHLTEHFHANLHYSLTMHTPDAEIVVLTNMVAQGFLTLSVQLPPRNDDPDYPGERLSKWGWAVFDYATKQQDSSQWRYPVVYTRSQHSLIPRPQLRSIQIPLWPLAQFPDESHARIPFWTDIHGGLIVDVWEMVFRSVLHLIVFRPGCTTATIAQSHHGVLGEWEVEMVLLWMERVGLAQRLATKKKNNNDNVHDIRGWKASQWWYCAWIPEVMTWRQHTTP